MLAEQGSCGDLRMLEPHRRDCTRFTHRQHEDQVDDLDEEIRYTFAVRDPWQGEVLLERGKHVHGPGPVGLAIHVFQIRRRHAADRQVCEYPVGPLEARRSLDQAVEQRTPGGHVGRP